MEFIIGIAALIVYGIVVRYRNTLYMRKLKKELEGKQ